MIDLEKLTGASVIIVGDVILDRYVFGHVHRISPEAPVPVVLAQRRTSVLGGAANVASNVLGLGARANLIGIRGSDSDGRALADLMAERSITSHVIVDPIRKTTTKTRILADGQQLLRLDEEDNCPLRDEIESAVLELIPAVVEASGAVVLSDYAKGTLSERICRCAIQEAHRRNLPVLVDPKGTDWTRYAGATCVTPNLRELSAVAGKILADERDIEEVGDALCKKLGLGRLLVTRGPDGMTLFEPGTRCLSFPAEAREVFDVSGAGDTALGTLSVALACGFTWDQAIRLANAAAGVVVGKLGTQPIAVKELRGQLERASQTRARKLSSLEEAALTVSAWRSLGDSIVFTNGCFDLLHVGHLKLLEAAAGEGDRLVVAINSDASVMGLKGNGRPILGQQERATLLSALPIVDLVVIFEEETPLEVITRLRPDVLVKGSDYRDKIVVGGGLVESYGGRVAFVELQDGISTTAIVQRIVRAAN